jgi:hypothetical protein
LNKEYILAFLSDSSEACAHNCLTNTALLFSLWHPSRRRKDALKFGINDGAEPSSLCSINSQGSKRLDVRNKATAK